MPRVIVQLVAPAGAQRRRDRAIQVDNAVVALGQAQGEMAEDAMV